MYYKQIGLDDTYLEDLRCVISDTVRAAELLPKHKPEGRDEAHAVSRSEALLPSNTLRLGELFLDRGTDFGDFFENVEVGGRFAAHISQ